jgi:hypothetical protein
MVDVHMQPPKGRNTAIDASRRSERGDREEKCNISTGDVFEVKMKMVMNLSVASSSWNARSNACYAKTLFFSFPFPTIRKPEKSKQTHMKFSEKADVPRGS